MRKINQETLIGKVQNHVELEKIRTMVFNKYQIIIYGLAIGAQDTKFQYSIYTRDKVSKSQILVLKYYIAGIVDCLRSF